jgi:hypothetical protein
MRAGTAIFREGGIEPITSRQTISLARDQDVLTTLAGIYQRHASWDMVGALAERAEGNNKVDWRYFIGRESRTALSGQGGFAVSLDNTGENVMAWEENGLGGRAVFKAACPGATVLIPHPANELHVSFRGVALCSPPFAVVTAIPLDGKELSASLSSLITVCGRCENTEMKFSADRRTVGTNWGKAPVMIEPVTGSVILLAVKGKWQCQALGPDGMPQADVPVVTNDKGEMVINLSPKYRTMWYLVTRSPDAKGQ